MTDTLNQRLDLLVDAVAADINGIVNGVDADLTAIRSNLANLQGEVSAIVNDSLTSGSTNTWSVNKIEAYVTAQLTAALGGVTPATLSTLQALEAGLAANQNELASILAAVSGAVRFDVDQSATISEAQQVVARKNIGAVSIADVDSTVNAALSALSPTFVDEDLAARYVSARNANLI